MEAILGTRDSQNGIFYLVKWKEREDLQFLPALLTFHHVPSLVIHFYAQRYNYLYGLQVNRGFRDSIFPIGYPGCAIKYTAPT